MDARIRSRLRESDFDRIDTRVTLMEDAARKSEDGLLAVLEQDGIRVDYHEGATYIRRRPAMQLFTVHMPSGKIDFRRWRENVIVSPEPTVTFGDVQAAIDVLILLAGRTAAEDEIREKIEAARAENRLQASKRLLDHLESFRT